MATITRNDSTTPLVPKENEDDAQLKLQQDPTKRQELKHAQVKQDQKHQDNLATPQGSTQGKGIAAQQLDTVHLQAAQTLLQQLTKGLATESKPLERSSEGDHAALETFAKLKAFLQVSASGDIAADFERAWQERDTSVPAGAHLLAGFSALNALEHNDTDLRQLKSLGLDDANLSQLKSSAPNERVQQWKSYAKLVERFYEKLTPPAHLPTAPVTSPAAAAQLDKLMPSLRALLTQYALPVFKNAQTAKTAQDIPELPGALVLELEKTFPQAALNSLVGKLSRMSATDLARLKKAAADGAQDASSNSATQSTELPGPLKEVFAQLSNHLPHASTFDSAAVPNFAIGDIDALISWVMMQSATLEEDILRDQLREMQLTLNHKKAQREKISAMRTAQTAMDAELHQELSEKQATGEVASTITFDQWKSYRQIGWGDGALADDGRFVGPSAKLTPCPDPLPTWLKTGAAAPVAGGATGDGAKYGLTAEQTAMLQDIYQHDPYCSTYASFGAFLRDAVGLKSFASVGDAISNEKAVAKFLKDLQSQGPTTTKSITPADSAANLAQAKDLLTQEAMLETLINSGLLPTEATKLLQAQLDSLKQQVSALFGKGMNQADVDTLLAWQGDTVNGLKAVINKAVGELQQFFTQAVDKAKKEASNANSASQADGEDDNIVELEYYTLDGNGMSASIRASEDNTDQDDYKTYYTNDSGTASGTLDDTPWSVNVDTGPSAANPLYDLLKKTLGQSGEELPIYSQYGPTTLDGSKLADGATQALSGFPQSPFAFSDASATGEGPIDQAYLDNQIQQAIDLQNEYLQQTKGITDYGDGTYSGGTTLDPELQALIDSKAQRRKTPQQIQAEKDAKATAEQSFSNTFGSGAPDDPAMAYNHFGNLEQFGAELENEKSKLDTMNEMSELQTMRLQGIMDKRQKLLEALSNMMKKMSQLSETIVSNLK